MSFFFLFAACYALLAIALALTGLDSVTAISGAAAAIANVGPGFGDTIGPAGNFASLPDSAKLLMSFGMLLGRLELFTVLILLAPAFWRGQKGGMARIRSQTRAMTDRLVGFYHTSPHSNIRLSPFPTPHLET